MNDADYEQMAQEDILWPWLADDSMADGGYDDYDDWACQYDDDPSPYDGTYSED